jgi:hypothetical protein
VSFFNKKRLVKKMTTIVKIYFIKFKMSGTFRSKKKKNKKKKKSGTYQRLFES